MIKRIEYDKNVQIYCFGKGETQLRNDYIASISRPSSLLSDGAGIPYCCSKTQPPIRVFQDFSMTMNSRFVMSLMWAACQIPQAKMNPAKTYHT